MDFLDKLEQLFINSDNITFQIKKESNLQYKDTIYINIEAGEYNQKEYIYIKEFINFLKNSEESSPYIYKTNSDNVSQYNFLVGFFYKINNSCLMNEILTLNPTDEDLLALYKKLHLLDKEAPSFLELLKEKSSFTQALKMGNSRILWVSNNNEFLEQLLKKGQKFNLSSDDYYDIFVNYINNSKTIKDKDNLFELFLAYISNNRLLENLCEALYSEKITIYNEITAKNVKKIEINSMSLIKKYKFISSQELDNLLDFFVDCIQTNMNNLHYISSIQCFKTTNEISDFSLYTLIIDTTNIENIIDLLDLYFTYFVEFSNNAQKFTEHLKDNPQIFKNFILYEKLNKKLNSKNITTEIIKI